jgi:hypothetical protein
MVELKRCSGYRGHWECEDKYPDHMVPVSNFNKDRKTKNGLHGSCSLCDCYGRAKRHQSYPRHPITGEQKRNWKSRYAESIGGARGTPEWKPLLGKAEVIWNMEINSPLLSTEPPTIPKFKSKKPKFNQGLYKSSLTTPRDSTKEVVPKEGPGFVYVFIDEMKMPGWRKIGATKVIDERLQDGNTWGAFTCLYRKEFKRRFEAETKIFALLDDYRVYSDKEWFKINTDLAIKTIEGMYELP